MSAEQLLDHFERISEAPDAIPRLRRFILNLAVRAKLVEQDPNDEKPQDVKKQDVSATPFNLPSNWEWARIGDQLNLVNGMAFKSTDWKDAGLRIVRIQNLNNSCAPFNFCDPGIARDRSLIDNGSFLISWSGTPGTSFGAFIWDRGPAVLNQHIFRCDFKTQLFDASFLRLAINGRLDEMISKAHGGVGLQHITKGKLEALLIPLPPLAEQRRIVARVDELMSLCDQLEAAKVEREQCRDSLLTASLQRLSKPAEDEQAFCEHARFAFTTLPRITTRATHVKQLRQAILNLAVRGKLVPQDPSDESIDVLLGRIKLDQQKSIYSGKLKRRTITAARQECKGLNHIPVEWCWVKLASLLASGPQNGISPREVKDVTRPKAVTLTATTSGLFNESHHKNVDLTIGECGPYWLSPGDMLFQRGNTREYVGMAALYEGPLEAYIFPDLMIRVRLCDSIDLRYVHMVMISPPLRAYFSDNASGASETMPKINQETVLSAPVPLPPLAEQHHIVAKVDELMILCDQLEAQIAEMEQDSCRFLEAVLNEALSPALAGAA